MDQIFATDVFVNRRWLRMTRRLNLPGTGVNNHRATGQGRAATVPTLHGGWSRRRTGFSARTSVTVRRRHG
jgi:hypothetical protein